MQSEYLKIMDIDVWRLRDRDENQYYFYRLNNAAHKTVGWIVADKVDDTVLLDKMAAALTTYVIREDYFDLESAKCFILLGKNAARLAVSENNIAVICAPSLSELSASQALKKQLWERLKPLRVLFDVM